MKYEWNPEKNEWLKKERKISFEQVIFHLSRGDIWKIADHPDQKNYPGQKIYPQKQNRANPIVNIMQYKPQVQHVKE